MNTSTTAQCGSEIVGETDLLPCPFCGGDYVDFYDNYIDHERKWSVSCGDCSANLDCCEDTKTEAAGAWNKRPDQSELAAARKALEEIKREAAKSGGKEAGMVDTLWWIHDHADAALSSKEPEGK